MAKKKVTKKEKANNIVLKNIGMIIEVAAFFVWTWLHVVIVIDGIHGVMTNTDMDIEVVTQRLILQTNISMIIYLVLYLTMEFINYNFYLKNKEHHLFVSLILEIVVLIVATSLIAGNYSILVSSIVYVPIITGLIKLLILKKEN